MRCFPGIRLATSENIPEIEPTGFDHAQPFYPFVEILFQIAMHLYWAKGIQNVSLNEICRQAKIAKTSFYREFESEDKLMELSIRMYFELFNRLLGELNTEGKSSLKVLKC